MGFTILELMVVIAISILLVGLLAPAVNSLAKTTLLTSSGNQIVNLVEFARQDAMSKNAMTALIMVDDPAMDNKDRTFAIFELTPSPNGIQSQTSDWKQISHWETLSAGVIVDQSMLQDSSTQPFPPFPALKYGASSPASYKYAVFLPGGALLSGSAAQIRLCEGYYPPGATAPIYTRPKAGSGPGSPANYYNITILAATGRPKIDRP
jgi:type II secretory pathway pseudopilin PulG